MAESKVRSLSGVVVSNKMDKTIVVRVDRQVKHPLYKKIIRKSTKIMAHDEHNSCEIGQNVRVLESPRFSKRKAWVLDSSSA